MSTEHWINLLPSSQSFILPKSSEFDSFLSIDKIVSATDYIDGFITIMEQGSPKRVTIEDKSSLISNSTLHLNLVNIVTKFMTTGSVNYSEDFLRIMDGKEM
uniref:Phage protein n=1 Tax=Heterorhabditis bacteriophora TaxID=37862 RepID=A0A1I7WMY1_HETBA